MRRRVQNQRPELPSGVEWYPQAYRADTAYAEYYDTLLVVGDSSPARIEALGLELTLIAEERPFRLYRHH